MATLEPEATTILPTNEPDAFQDLNNSTTVDLSSDQLFSMLTADSIGQVMFALQALHFGQKVAEALMRLESTS